MDADPYPQSGPQASRIQQAIAAEKAFKGKVGYFVDTVFNYPTLAECYKAAAFNGLNRLAKIP